MSEQVKVGFVSNTLPIAIVLNLAGCTDADIVGSPDVWFRVEVAEHRNILVSYNVADQNYTVPCVTRWRIEEVVREGIERVKAHKAKRKVFVDVSNSNAEYVSVAEDIVKSLGDHIVITEDPKDTPIGVSISVCSGAPELGLLDSVKSPIKQHYTAVISFPFTGSVHTVTAYCVEELHPAITDIMTRLLSTF